jgi:hypothetical protein
MHNLIHGIDIEILGAVKIGIKKTSPDQWQSQINWNKIISDHFSQVKSKESSCLSNHHIIYTNI